MASYFLSLTGRPDDMRKAWEVGSTAPQIFWTRIATVRDVKLYVFLFLQSFGDFIAWNVFFLSQNGAKCVWRPFCIPSHIQTAKYYGLPRCNCVISIKGLRSRPNTIGLSCWQCARCVHFYNVWTIATLFLWMGLSVITPFQCVHCRCCSPIAGTLDRIDVALTLHSSPIQLRIPV